MSRTGVYVKGSLRAMNAINLHYVKLARKKKGSTNSWTQVSIRDPALNVLHATNVVR